MDVPTACVTWLHLSDWHQGRPDYDRALLLKRMLEDIGQRARRDPRLETIDFVVFSGDIAFSGTQSEYAAAQKQVIDPLKKLLGETMFFFAPGNHDLDRGELGNISLDWRKAIALKTSNRQKEIGTLLYHKTKAAAILAPFDNFYRFAAENNCDYLQKTVTSRTVTRGKKSAGFVALNTAFCCDRHKVSFTDDPTSWDHDYGMLSISEQQLDDAIARVKDCDVRILVMHHPISWMHESEQAILEQKISSQFDLVLYGHEHLPRFSSVSGNFGDIKFIPAGAAYANRWTADPRYSNAFNFGVIDLETDEGAIYHRRWVEEHDQWESDQRYWPQGVARFLVQRNPLPENLKYLFEAQRRYKPFHAKRPAKNAEITLVHERVEVQQKTFLQARIRYKVELYPGPAEQFTFVVWPNKRVLKHSSKQIQERAFEKISMTPEPEPVDENEFRRIINLPESTSGTTTIEYVYNMLECENGLWSFVLGRFIDNVRIVIKKADGYEYEYVSIGGFPNLQPEQDNFLKFESLESDAGHLPHQGYMVQWYPA